MPRGQESSVRNHYPWQFRISIYRDRYSPSPDDILATPVNHFIHSFTGIILGMHCEPLLATNGLRKPS